MHNQRPKLCWITPDYFLNVDAKIVPHLATHYSIDWILVRTPDSQRTAQGLLPAEMTPRECSLKYRQRDPRIIFQYVALLRSIRKAGYDLVYTSFHGLPYFLFVLRLLIDPERFIYGFHNVETPRGAVHERSMRFYARYAFTVFHRFHVFSKNQLRAITQLAPDKRHYYAPLAPDDYGPSDVLPGRKKIRFLFFGYIRRYKRLDLLINAFQSLYRSGVQNIELLIAGSCDDWEQYERLIDRSSSAVITRIGLIPNSEIPDIISSSHYIVMPYQDGAQSAVLSLAYAYNKPVITSDIEAFTEAVLEGATGFCFSSESQDSLGAVMKDVVLQHDHRYGMLVRQVEAYAARECSTSRILDLYRAFIDETLTSDWRAQHRTNAPLPLT